MKEYADTVVVIDDGSSDKTSRIAKLAGATVITMPENGGKAKAMLAGFAYAKKLGAAATVMMDGDGQHRPEDIPRVAAPVLAGVADLVVGSRFMDSADASEEGIQGYRKFGQKVLNTATNVSAGARCSDSQSGFRALSLRALGHCDFTSEGYGIESDMLAHFAGCDLRITEVPITVAYDVPNMHKMNPVKHGLSVLSGIVQLFTVKHPLICFGVPGAVFVAVGVWLAIMAFNVVAHTGVWATTNTLLSAMMIIMGMLLWSVALILYSISRIVGGGR